MKNQFYSKEVKMFYGEFSVAGALLTAALATASASIIMAGGQITSGVGGTKIITVPAGGNATAVQNAVASALSGVADSGLAGCAGGIAEMLATILSSITILCYVSREVYGYRNENWMAFRKWIMLDAPKVINILYSNYGKYFAKFISDKPNFKNKIRKIMDFIIT